MIEKIVVAVLASVFGFVVGWYSKKHYPNKPNKGSVEPPQPDPALARMNEPDVGESNGGE